MDETAAAWIEAAVGSLERMRLLVQDILAYARSGNREIEPRSVSVEEASRSALAALEAKMQARAAEVRLREPLPTVAAHDEHLANVIERLLDNAVRYVPADRVPIVEVFAHEGPDEWVITIADNGAGIPAELSERVFDVFYRGAKATNSGTGLGLSLSRKLVDRMGGRIWVEPRPDTADGTWIRFALPKDVT
jgi:signal transduction histidine kinase